MRTSIDTNVANRTVFGFGQDRVVATWNDVTCDHAAQHLSPWHAGNRARIWSRELKHSGLAVTAGAARMAMLLCMAITGPKRQPVRLVSPVLVRV